MLKQFKIITLAPTFFIKTTKYGFSVLVGIDVVNVMAAYQPVAQACG
jgi:hypothetical protein